MALQFFTRADRFKSESKCCHTTVIILTGAQADMMVSAGKMKNSVFHLFICSVDQKEEKFPQEL